MSPSSSPAIRRARFTYGRRRNSSIDDTSFEAANTSIESHQDLQASTSPSSGHLQPPPSDDAEAFNTSLGAEDASDDEGDEGGSVHFEFSWRKHMKAIDDQYDAGGFRLLAKQQATSADGLETRAATSSGRDALAEDIFGGTLPILTSSSQPPASPSGIREPRKTTSPSSSDLELQADPLPSSPQTSPQHPLGTPKLHSSPTPPTSIEMPPKGKGKARAVEPLRFDRSGDDSASSSKPSRPSRKRKGQDAAKRVKAPTKKERVETTKATARMTANTTASIASVPVQGMYTLTRLMDRVAVPAPRPKSPPPATSSDPIQAFTSPDYTERQVITRRTVSPRPTSKSVVHVDLDSDSDASLPDGKQLLAEAREKDALKRGEEARERKQLDLRAFKNQIAAVQVSVQDDDSDLEIVDDPRAVAHDEAQLRRGLASRGLHPTAGSKKQLSAAGPGARRESIKRNVLAEGNAKALLKNAAQPAFGPSKPDKTRLEREQLNKLLREQANKQAAELIRKKEGEWERRGGKLKTHAAPVKDLQTVMCEMAKKHQEALANKHNRAETVHDSDSDSDQDWKPDEDDAMEGDMDAENSGDEQSRAQVVSPDDPEDQADDEGDDENPFYEPRRPVGISRRPAHKTIESDDEDDAENRAPSQPIRSRVLVRDASWARSEPEAEAHALEHQQSLSSLGEHTEGTPDGNRTEEGTDKENDVRLSFDRGEDKENTVIAIQSPISMSSRLGRLGSLFAASTQASPAGSAGRGVVDGVRSPLKELPADDDDDPFAFTPGPLLSLAGPSRDSGGLDSSPLDLGAGSGLDAPFSLSMKGKDKAQERSTSPSPLGEELDLGGGFGGGGGGFSQFFTQEGNAKGFSQLKAAQDADDISLTMDTGLQPALEISNTFRKKADEIFEKEQEQIALQEQANVQPAAPEMFVDANGFLTQTKPQFISPTQRRTPWHPSYGVRFSSPGSSSLASSAIRAPFGVLPTQDLDDDDVPVRMRLHKREHDHLEALTPKLPSLNDVLGKRPAKEKGKVKLGHSEFIEGEAEESDDDAKLGFGLVRGGGDEEEDSDDDQDRIVEGLVDDKEMDAKTLAEDAVLEKYREDEEQTDQKLQKLATDAATGKLRLRRRNRGVGLDDSDSEDDEERAARPKAKKARTNDNIAALAKSEETKAFAEEYSANMFDDDAEFAHLKEDRMEIDLDDEEESEEERPEITADQLRKDLREVARRADEGFNADDVSWADDGLEDEDEHRVREVSDERAPAARLPNAEDALQKPGFASGNVPENWSRWAKSEKSSRTVGVTGRSTGASAAVTGHGKGNGSFKAGRSSASSSTTNKSTKIAKKPSMLSAVPTRRSKFGN